ncbi:MAG: purine-nucleoside phosphorylase [Bowdeniella nasicola]|nr:purine-nucleoside phosphorylase [Bowdeniella nasicola]
MSQRRNEPAQLAEAAAQIIREKTGIARHDLAIILGSGWGQAATLLGEVNTTVTAAELPGFYAEDIAGHGGAITSVRIGDTAVNALVITARTHYYQGHGAAAVAHPVRTAAACGARHLVITNGCGGLNPQWTPGTPVLIRDHINLTGDSPIAGAHFVDLTDAYSPALRRLAHQVDPTLAEGVYVQFRGPHYETPAEVKMAGILGGDLVGMSTSLETIAAREAQMDVLGISLVTNHAAGMSDVALSHEDVLAAGAAAAPRIARLLADIVMNIARSIDA